MKAGSFAGDKSLCGKATSTNPSRRSQCHTLRRPRGPRAWKSRRRPTAAPGDTYVVSVSVRISKTPRVPVAVVSKAMS